MHRVTKHIRYVHLVRLIKLKTWISPLLLLFVQSTSTKVTRNTCIAEPRVALGGGGVGMARKSLGMGKEKNNVNRVLFRGGERGRIRTGSNVKEPQ